MASMALIACMALTSCSSPAEKIVKIYEDAIEQLNATDDPHLASEIMDKACDEADEIRLSKDFNPTEEEVNVYLEARDRLRNAHIKALNRKFIREYNSGKYSKSSEPQDSELDYDNNYGGGSKKTRITATTSTKHTKAAKRLRIHSYCFSPKAPSIYRT